MSDDGYRPGNFPAMGEQNFSENGSETMENDQTGLPSWAAALTAQMQASFAAQMMQMREAQERREADDRAALHALLEECRASARDARVARAQLQDRQYLRIFLLVDCGDFS